MAVKTVPLKVDMRGGTHIENVTKLVQDALAGTRAAAGIVTAVAANTTTNPRSDTRTPSRRVNMDTSVCPLQRNLSLAISPRLQGVDLEIVHKPERGASR